MGLALLRVVKAAYGSAHSYPIWLGNVLGALRCLDEGAGVILALTELTEMGPRVREVASTCPPIFVDRFRRWVESVPAAASGVLQPPVGSLASLALGRAHERLFDPSITAHGVFDAAILQGPLGPRRVFGAYVPLLRPPTMLRDTLHRLRLVGIHLAAGRAAWDAEPSVVPERALLFADPATSPAPQTVWEGIASGRLSVAERFERDGHCYLVARTNSPVVANARRLNAREIEVVKGAVFSPSQKHVAYTLGYSHGTVSRHLTLAMLKLGITSRCDLASVIRALGVSSEGSAEPTVETVLRSA